jgi:hypothetical protein
VSASAAAAAFVVPLSAGRLWSFPLWLLLHAGRALVACMQDDDAGTAHEWRADCFMWRLHSFSL